MIQTFGEHLLANLITDPAATAAFRRHFDCMDEQYRGMHHPGVMYRAQVKAILLNDYHSTTLGNFSCRPEIVAWRNYQKGKRHHLQATNKYITG